MGKIEGFSAFGEVLGNSFISPAFINIYVVIHVGIEFSQHLNPYYILEQVTFNLRQENTILTLTFFPKMQSQLAAALLGHNTNATSTPSHLDDDENNSFREEDTEVEQEEFDEVFCFFFLVLLLS